MSLNMCQWRYEKRNFNTEIQEEARRKVSYILAFPQPVGVETNGQKEEALFLSLGKWDQTLGLSFIFSWVECWASLSHSKE